MASVPTTRPVAVRDAARNDHKDGRNNQQSGNHSEFNKDDFGKLGRVISPEPLEGPELNRIRRVRMLQGMTQRTAARRMGITVSQVRREEEEAADLSISDLQRWGKALEVPISELLSEPEATLSGNVADRAKMVRLMKTAVALQEQATSLPVKRLAQTLVDQLIELMPELRDVGPWHTGGTRRRSGDVGLIALRPVPDDLLG